MKILKLLRVENFALLAFVQLIFRYGFLELQPGLLLALSHWQYALLILASVLIAAGGSLMEAISRPEKYANGVTEAQGYNIYIALNLAAAAIGYYIADYIGRPGFVAVYIVSAALLFISATNFRQSMLASNIIISIVTALSIIVIGIFNFYPFLGLEDKILYTTMFSLMLDYAAFAFIITLIYTLVIDLRNTDTDYNSGKNTLPIALGRDRTAKVVFALTVIPVGMLLYYAQTYISSLLWALCYGLAFILGPLLYFMFKIWSAKSPAEFRHLGFILKAVMAFTAISVAVVAYNIAHNA